MTRDLVLIIDDQPMIRSLTKEFLSRQGYRVMTASSGLEGIALFDEHIPELKCVLLDISMPEMDGCEVLARLKKIDPSVKVVLISGYGNDYLRNKYSLDEAQLCLQKPFNSKQLMQAIESCWEVPRASHRAANG
ncbi:response regulator [Oligoflexia bacterium]|nr:response regulator [Oligoflexia bacterium]